MPPESSDFLDLAETPQNMDIDADIGDLALEETSVVDMEGFVYPSILLSGVAFADTLRILQTLVRKSYRSVDVWLDPEDGGSPSKLGTLPLDLETLLVLRYLGVRATAYLDLDVVEILDLSSTDVLEKFL